MEQDKVDYYDLKEAEKFDDFTKRNFTREWEKPINFSKSELILFPEVGFYVDI